MEQTFDENIYTLQGRMLHERADEPSGVVDDGIRVERGLPLWSRRLGLVGKADVVEFYGDIHTNMAASANGRPLTCSSARRQFAWRRYLGCGCPEAR